MTTQHMLHTRLRIYLRRECFVWLSRRSEHRILFGWILGCHSARVLFKQNERQNATVILITDIEGCGAV
jgi:hypothetical protein